MEYNSAHEMLRRKLNLVEVQFCGGWIVIFRILVLIMVVLFSMPKLCFAAPIKLLVTTFPVETLLRNVTSGVTSVEIKVLLASELGCPHDYILSPQDMQKIAAADVLVGNGLGLEEFLGAAVARANSKISVIEVGKGALPLLFMDAEGGRGSRVVNPHVFASPRMMGKMAKFLAGELGKIAPIDRAIFEKNADAYAKKMEVLANEFLQLGKKLKNNRIITQHGVFDYLAADMGLQVVGVVQDHPGREPSASETLKLSKTIKAQKVGAVLTEPQYSSKFGRLVALESGIPVGELDPVASGPASAQLDYYEKAMRSNLTVIKNLLGG
jgi:zinc transport system substrate-binding protein